MPDILAFFGLSMRRWEQGFASQEDIFRWIATSPFVLPLVKRYRSPNYRASTKEARPMRIDFIRFLGNPAFEPSVTDPSSVFAGSASHETKLETALKHFGKDKEHATLVYIGRAQRRAREVLNGRTVQQWTGVQGMPVRFIMDEVKDRLSDTSLCTDEAPPSTDVPTWQRALMPMSEEEVRALVVEVKTQLEQDGRLSFDWRAAKAAKQEKKRLKDLGEDGLTEVQEQVAALKVAAA